MLLLPTPAAAFATPLRSPPTAPLLGPAAAVDALAVAAPPAIPDALAAVGVGATEAPLFDACLGAPHIVVCAMVPGGCVLT